MVKRARQTATCAINDILIGILLTIKPKDSHYSVRSQFPRVCASRVVALLHKTKGIFLPVCSAKDREVQPAKAG